MKTIYKLAIVLDGTKIVNINVNAEIQKNDTIEISGIGEIHFKEINFDYAYNDGNKEIKHYTCIGKTKSSLVGVRQVKFIQGSSYDDMEQKLNEFLNDTKFTHAIEDITYTMAYVAIRYKLKNKHDICASKSFYKNYQEN